MPHSGYHRIVGFDRPFFEGWYFRVTLPEARDNLSLIYHVFDPDAKSSPRRAAGAQVCAPGGGYLFRESPNVDAFDAHPRHLALRMPMEPGSRAASGDARSPPSGSSPEEEFFEVSDAGARHRGYLTRDARMDDPDVWPPENEWTRRVGISPRDPSPASAARARLARAPSRAGSRPCPCSSRTIRS